MKSLAELEAMRNRSEAVGNFVAAVKYKALARSAGEAERMAAAHGASRKVLEILRKDAVPGGTTASESWAFELLGAEATESAAFVASLAQSSVFDWCFANGARRAPMRTPLITASGTLTGSAVDEGSGKPLSQFTLARDRIEPRKVASFIVVSRDLLREGGARGEAFLSAELRRAVARGTDAAFIASIPTESPALASAGATAANVRTDLAALLAAIDLEETSRPVLAVETEACKFLSVLGTTTGAAAFPGMTPTGGEIGGIPVRASDGLTAATAVMIDASGVIGDPGVVLTSTSEHAALEMDTAPDMPAALVSMWQTNSVAMRAERALGWEFTRTRVAAVLTGVTWGAAA